MAATYPKGWERVKHHTQRVGRWTWRGIAAVLFTLGLGQIPDEVTVWERWITAVKASPHVHALAEALATIGGFLDIWWVRATLIIAALLILGWRTKPIWRARHKILFGVRKLVAERVWIKYGDAVRIVEVSPWAAWRRGDRGGNSLLALAMPPGTLRS